MSECISVYPIPVDPTEREMEGRTSPAREEMIIRQYWAEEREVNGVIGKT